MTRSEVYWKKQSFQWKWFGPPLRPSTQDIAFLQRLIADHFTSAGCTSPSVVLLGVTPEITAMPWPSETRLFAVDHNMTMIRNVWRGNPLIRSAAMCAEWTAMPIAGHSCDMVVGDGFLCQLSYPETHHAFSREVRRVLKPSGFFATRAFVRPEISETIATVFNDLLENRIGNFHVFKWRLAMAVQADVRAGVRLCDIWNTWNNKFPEPETLALKLNWPIETIRTIDAQRGLNTCMAFPTLAELREVLSAHFSEMACLFPGYELGDRCPTLFYKPL